MLWLLGWGSQGVAEPKSQASPPWTMWWGTGGGVGEEAAAAGPEAAGLEEAEGEDRLAPTSRRRHRGRRRGGGRGQERPASAEDGGGALPHTAQSQGTVVQEPPALHSQGQSSQGVGWPAAPAAERPGQAAAPRWPEEPDEEEGQNPEESAEKRTRRRRGRRHRGRGGAGRSAEGPEGSPGAPAAAAPAPAAGGSASSGAAELSVLLPQATRDLLLEDPLLLADDKTRCAEVLERLEDSSQCQAIVDWLCLAARPLALTREGTRVVQKALEVVQGEGRKMALLQELSPHTVELMESPNGNFAVTRAVEVMPVNSLMPFVQEVLDKGPASLAKHRMGCRLLERLIEHVSEPLLSPVLDKIIEEVADLSKNAYGNYVVQSVLEHGAEPRRQEVLEKLLAADLPTLAMHRSASHVVQKALDYGDEVYRDRLVRVLLEAPKPSLIQVACSRYGLFVLETIAGLKKPPPPPQAGLESSCGALARSLGQAGLESSCGAFARSLGEVRLLLGENLPALVDSPYGHRVAVKFGLVSQGVPAPSSKDGGTEADGLEAMPDP